MAKYITTDKHPELKENMILEHSIHGNQHYTPSNMYHATDQQIVVMVEKGFIKEAEQPEFTKSDMIDFRSWSGSGTEEEASYDFNEWDKLNKK